MREAEKFHPMGFRVQERQLKFLKKMAKMKGCSLSMYVREILEKEMRSIGEMSDDPILEVAGIFATGTLSKDIDRELYEK